MIDVPKSNDDAFVHVPRALTREHIEMALGRALDRDIAVSQCATTNLCSGKFGGVSNSGSTVLRLDLAFVNGETHSVVAKILSPAAVNLFKIDCRFDSREGEIKWAEWWGEQGVPFVPVVYDTRFDQVTREFWILQEYFTQVGWDDVQVSGMKHFSVDEERLAHLFQHAADLHSHSAGKLEDLLRIFPDTGIKHACQCLPAAIADGIAALCEDTSLCNTIGLSEDEKKTLRSLVDAIENRPAWVDGWQYVCVSNDLAPDNFALRISKEQPQYVTFDWSAAYLAPMEQDMELLLWRLRELDAGARDRLLPLYLESYAERTGQSIDQQDFANRMPWAPFLFHVRMIAEHAECLRWVPHQTLSREFIHGMIKYCSTLRKQLKNEDA